MKPFELRVFTGPARPPRATAGGRWWGAVLLTLTLCAPTVQAEPPAEDTPPPEEAPIAPPEMLAPTLDAEAAKVLETLEASVNGADRKTIARSLRVVSLKTARPAFEQALKHGDERVRRAAVVALRDLKARRDTDLLVNALQDPAPAVVGAAASALARLDPRKAPAHLEALLTHPSVAVRCRVAATLGASRSRDAAKMLSARLDGAESAEERACLLKPLVKRGDRDAAVAATPLLSVPDTRALGVDVLAVGSARVVLPALTQALQEGGEAAATGALAAAEAHGQDGIDWVTELLGHPSPVVRRAATGWLVHRADSAGVQKALRKSARTGDPGLRSRVIDALARTGGEDLVSLAREWLTDADPRVRAAAARVYVAHPRKSDATVLLRAYQDERKIASEANLPVREALLRAMGALASADHVPVFVDAFGQEGERQAAVDGLVAVGSPAVRTLLLVLKVGDMQRIPYALEALARIGSGVGDAAEGLFRHPREIVRRLGRDLMAASADPAAVDSLQALFESDDLDDPVPVVEAIATFTSDKAQRVLFQAAVHPNPAVRAAAVAGLGETHVRTTEVVKTVRRVLETDDDPEVRVAALRALFRLGDPGLSSLLQRVVQYDTVPVRVASWEVMGWLGDPAAAPLLGVAISDAEGDAKQVAEVAGARLTRDPSLTSTAGLTRWSREIQRAGARRVGGQRGKVTSGDVAITYREAGTGPAVIALAGDHASDALHPSLDLLAQQGYRVVTIDGRGRGQTELGEVPVTVATEVADVEAVRQALSIESATVVGHDIGAYVAAAYAKAHPERVRSLVLLSAPLVANRHGVAVAATRRLEGRWAEDLASLDEKHAWYAPAAWLRYRHVAVTPGLVKEVSAAPVVASFPIGSVASNMLRRELAGFDAQPVLEGLSVPVALVVGEAAPLENAELAAMQRLARSVEHVSLRTIPGAGHYPHLEQPAQTAAVLRTTIR